MPLGESVDGSCDVVETHCYIVQYKRIDNEQLHTKHEADEEDYMAEHFPTICFCYIIMSLLTIYLPAICSYDPCYMLYTVY